jgi:hypothetical protein
LHTVHRTSYAVSKGEGLLEDIDNDWMAGLDWSKYRRPAADYVSDTIMLAGVVDMFARQVCGPYPTGIEFFLSKAGNTPPGSVVPAEDAFAPDGTPFHSVHKRLDTIMRSHADDLEVPIARPDVIGRDEWARIHDTGMDRWNLGLGARRAVAGLAPIVTRLAAEERLECHARPIHGGPKTISINGREWWDLDPEQSVRRIASSGLNLSKPYDPYAEPDHIIFVSPTGLQKVILDSAREHYVATAFREHGEWAVRRKVDYYAVQVAEVTAFLVTMMNSGNCETFTNRDFEAEVSLEFGSRGLGRCFERAKAAAVADAARSRFAKRRASRL